jgi:hypothetical protein
MALEKLRCFHIHTRMVSYFLCDTRAAYELLIIGYWSIARLSLRAIRRRSLCTVRMEAKHNGISTYISDFNPSVLLLAIWNEARTVGVSIPFVAV